MDIFEEMKMHDEIRKEIRRHFVGDVEEPSSEPSGETIVWEGVTYEVPCDAQIEYWLFDSLCETPDERIVEPDHPDSWLVILGIF